jgi:hypothetical protein
MQPTIEGASPEQRQILLEILAGLASSEISGIFVSPHTPVYEDDVAPPPRPFGDRVAVDFPSKSLRPRWEATLLAEAFVARSRRVGLTKIAWLGLPREERSLEWVGEPCEPLDAEALENLQQSIAAASGNTLERVHVLRPDAHALAVTLRIAEPHAFLRDRLHDFTMLAEHEWIPLLAGLYLEVRDAELDPAYVLARHGSGGMSSSRGNLECCAPRGFGRPEGAPPPPACPIFG